MLPKLIVASILKKSISQEKSPPKIQKAEFQPQFIQTSKTQ